MYMCMDVDVHMCVSVCVCARVCVHVYVCMCMCVCVCMLHCTCGGFQFFVPANRRFLVAAASTASRNTLSEGVWVRLGACGRLGRVAGG